MSTLDEQIEAVRAVVGELSGNPGNWYLDKLRDVLATLEGMAAPGDQDAVLYQSPRPHSFKYPPPGTSSPSGPHDESLSNRVAPSGGEIGAGDSPSPQQPTQEARVDAVDYLDDWFGFQNWPPVHRFPELLAGFAALRVTAAPVSGDARAIADKSIDARVCCEKLPPCRTEAWRIALAKDIDDALTAATDKARRGAIEECAELLRRAAEISDPGWQTQQKFKSMIDATLALSPRDAAPGE